MIRLILLLREPLVHKRAAIAIAIFGAFLVLPSIFGGFAADDHFLRMVSFGFPGMPELEGRSPIDTFVFADGTLERNAAFRERGLVPWWTDPHARLAFWRPLASMSHYLDFHIFGDHAWIMHLQNLVWYALLIYVLSRFYDRLIDARWIAIFAAFLYAVDDAHGMPVGWISNRNALMCMTFGVSALIMHDRWRRQGEVGAAPFAVALFGIGLLCGEATLAICGYLFAHAMFLDRGGRIQGILSLIPYGLVILPWRFVYQAMGYGATGSGMYIDPVRETGLFFHTLIERMPLLLNAQLAYPPAALTVWAPELYQRIHIAVSIIGLLFLFWVFFPLLRQSPVARFWVLGMSIAVLPVCATFPMDRLLFFVGIGGMGLIAQFLGGMAESVEKPEKPSWTRRDTLWRGSAVLAAWAFIIIHVIVSPFSVPVRGLTMAFTGRALQKSVTSLPAHQDTKEKNIVLITTPSDFDGWHVPIMRSSLGIPVPAHTWALTVGPFITEVERESERNLILRPNGGFVPKPWARMFRGLTTPFTPGETIEMEGLTVEILDVTEEDRRPTAVRFIFDRPLEDDSLLWFNYENGVYNPWAPPDIGKTAQLPGPYMFGLGSHYPEDPPDIDGISALHE